MLDKIRGVVMTIISFFQSLTARSLANIQPCVSAEMINRIALWRAIARGEADWNDENPTAGVPQQIAGLLASIVQREIDIECKNKAIETVMTHLDKNVDKLVDYMTLFGGCLLRPIFSNDKLQYEIIPQGDYLAEAYDLDGTLTACVIAKKVFDEKHAYVLLERHSYKNKAHSVECTLYKADNGYIENKVPLTACDKTKDLTPNYTWEGAPFPMIIEFRNHQTNPIDSGGSPVAILCGAEGLIKDADEQYTRMKWEQEAGTMRTFVDRQMLAKKQLRDGQVVDVKLGNTLNKMLVMIDGDDSTKITEHAPTLRTAQQNEMFQQILRRIELVTNIGKGTISDMESVQQTATQYSGGRSTLFACVDKIEDELEAKYRQSAKVFNYMACAYSLEGAGGDDITVKWNDDKTRRDIIQAKQVAMQEVQNGIMGKDEYRMTFYNEDEATAKAKLPQEEAQDTFGGLFGEE